MPFDEDPEWNPGAGICPNCGKSINNRQQLCYWCGTYVNGWHECGKDRCGSCHEKLHDGDKYCRICGTKVGEGEYKPYHTGTPAGGSGYNPDSDIRRMQCVYGPPPCFEPRPLIRTHVCSSCGYSWTTDNRLDRDEYCPECGGIAPVAFNIHRWD